MTDWFDKLAITLAVITVIIFTIVVDIMEVIVTVYVIWLLGGIIVSAAGL